MLIVDYILTTRRDPGTASLINVVFNVGKLNEAQNAIEEAYFLGRADGAPFSKIVLADSAGQEYMLPLKLPDSEEAEIAQFFKHTLKIDLCSLENDAGNCEPFSVPLSLFASEISSIQATMRLQDAR